MLSLPATTTSTPFRRPLSLPPSSPFLDPFDSPLPVTPDHSSARRSAVSVISQAGSIDSPASPNQVRVAYVAGTSRAGLLDVLDLSPVVIRRVKRGSAMADKRLNPLRDRAACPSASASASPVPLPPPISMKTTTGPDPVVEESPTSILRTPPTTAPSQSSVSPVSPLPPYSTDYSPASMVPEAGMHVIPSQLQEERSFLDISERTSTVYSDLSSVPSSAGALQRSKVLGQYPGLHQTLNGLPTLYENGVDTNHRRPLPPNDESFFRFSISTASEGSPPIYRPRQVSLTPSSRRWRDDADVEELSSRPASGLGSLPHPSILRRESTGSGNTFGSRRRWSAHASSIEASSDQAQQVSDQQHPDEHGRVTSKFSSSGTGSAPTSACQPVSGAAHHTLQHRRGAESEAPIQAHLLKLAAKSERHVVPAASNASNSPVSPAHHGPPSNGLPLTAAVREETHLGESDTSSYVRSPVSPARGMQSKLDQVLGPGAEKARLIEELDRRAVVSVLEVTRGPGPVPPHRKGHKLSISAPFVMPTTAPRSLLPPIEKPPVVSRSAVNAPLDDFQQELPKAPHTPATNSPDELHRIRSGSLESLPSSSRSLSESVHTLTRLLPGTPYKGLPPLPTRTELDPEQRLRLLHRARKLHQMLGESLNERDMERLVVEPHTVGTTVVTHFSEDFPSHPTGVPEWDREDCLPQTVIMTNAKPPSVPARPGSALAHRARATLGMEKNREGDLKVYVQREMRVSETNLGITAAHRQPGVNRRSSQPKKPGVPVSPAGRSTSEWEDENDDLIAEAAARRIKRQQLVKLQRLLGVPVPPSFLTPSSTDDLSPSVPPTAVAPPQSSLRTGSGESFIDLTGRGLGSRTSSPSPASWANKLKQSMTIRERKPKFMSDAASSFLDMRGSTTSGAAGAAGLGAGGTSSIDMGSGMSEGEKSAARKKAQKLEQVFGNAPPRDMFLSPHRSAAPLSEMAPNITSPSAVHNPNSSADHSISHHHSPSRGRAQTLDSYTQSIEGLLYLAENDQPRLATLIDSLDSDSASDGDMDAEDDFGVHGNHGYHGNHGDDLAAAPSPSSHAARRRRTGKLSHFFGETGVDFDRPPQLQHARHIRNPAQAHSGGGAGAGAGPGGRGGGDRAGRSRGRSEAAQGKRQKRRETLEGVLGELWRGLQSEVHGGGVSRGDVERLGEMVGLLRRSRSGWEEL